ncbi:hypothetical protein, partial [Actinomadura kijaniata]|uniref:hypothetical protein n=1 Tax=Actinomadura kijaniata TaxID=46161 RepID=UPI0031DFE2EE
MEADDWSVPVNSTIAQAHQQAADAPGREPSITALVLEAISMIGSRRTSRTVARHGCHHRRPWKENAMPPGNRAVMPGHVPVVRQAPRSCPVDHDVIQSRVLTR